MLKENLLICVLALLITSSSLAQNSKQIYYRNSIDKSVKNKSVAKVMFKSLKEVEERSFLYQGYFGIAYMFKSRHSWNPVLKFTYFKKGKGILDSVISKNPKNVELRFYRAMIQRNIPAFLNYKDNLKSDENFIFRSLDTLTDTDLKARILKYKKSVSNKED